VPVMAVLLWNLLIAVYVIGAYFLFGGNAVVGTGYLAGIGAVPASVSYFFTALLCPFFIWRTDRTNFGVLRHALPALIGVIAIGNGIYQSVSPNQPPPGNGFWVYIAAIFVVALCATLFVLATRGSAIDRLGITAPAEERGA